MGPSDNLQSGGACQADKLATLAARLCEDEVRVATAESCTGGQLAALFAADERLGPWLDRGFVAYCADAKCEMLGVARDDAERDDGVNAEAARSMAEGALKRSGADIGSAITGFCGPQKENEEVGLVYVALADNWGTTVVEHHFGDIGRTAVLDAAVWLAVDILAKWNFPGDFGE